MQQMTLVTVICFGLFNTAPVSATTPVSTDRQGDIQAIEALYATWRQAVETGDIPEYVSLLHPDVRLLPPGAQAISSAADYEAFLQPVFATATYRIEVQQMPQIHIRDNVAVAEYQYTIHLQLKDAANRVTEPGALTAGKTTARYFDVLLKEAGQWRVWRHSWQVY